MLLTLTMWQKKKVGHPTRAGEGRLEDPTEETFGAAIVHLLMMVESGASPFQIVARVGDSSRALQFESGWDDASLKAELWRRYRRLASVNG